MIQALQRVHAENSFTPKSSWPKLTWIGWILLAIFAVLAQPARADEDEDKYLRIVDIIQQADALKEKGKTSPALAKYQEAQSELKAFRRAYADWNPNIVAYRQKYVAERIQSLTEPVTVPADTAATPAASAAPSEIKSNATSVLNAGAEPRKALRLHPKAGDKQSVSLEVKMSTATKLGGMETPAMKLPAMLMSLELTVQSVSEQGEINYSAVVTEASVAEDAETAQMAAVMKPALAGFKGVTTTGTISSRGSSQGVKVQGGDAQAKQATDMLTQSFGAFSIPLPEEPVGPGAQWVTREPVKSQGITFDQTTTYQLVSVEDDKVVLKASLTQSAAKQQIQSPAMPGMKMDLTKMTGNGTGDLTISLGQLLPQQAEMKSHSELSMAMNAGGQKQAMSMNIDVDMRIQPK